MKISFFEKTDVGRVRQANEDNMGHLDLSWGWIFTVCDGMGGHVGGATASSIAVKSILSYLGQQTAPENPAQELAKALEFANEQIYATALNQPELRGMGTTAVIMMVIESSVWLAHVGDSRAYILNEDKLHRLTRDHSFVQKLVDNGIIREEEMEEHPRKNELTRALGTQASVEAEVSVRPVHPQTGDLFLLCSDGLYGMIDKDEIHRILTTHPKLPAATERLVFAANEWGGHDNITVQLVRIDQSPHAKSRFDTLAVRSDLAHTQPGSQQNGGGPPPSDNATGFNSLLRKPFFLVGATAVLVSLIFLVIMNSGGGGENGGGGGGGADSSSVDNSGARMDSLSSDTFPLDSNALPPVDSNITDTSKGSSTRSSTGISNGTGTGNDNSTGSSNENQP